MNGTFIYNGKQYHRELLYRGEEARYFGTNGHGEIIVTMNADLQDNPDWILCDKRFLELIECKKLEA